MYSNPQFSHCSPWVYSNVSGSHGRFYWQLRVAFLDMVLNFFVDFRPDNALMAYIPGRPISNTDRTVFHQHNNSFLPQEKTFKWQSVSFLEICYGTCLLSTGQPLAMYFIIWQRTVSFGFCFCNTLLVSGRPEVEWFVSEWQMRQRVSLLSSHILFVVVEDTQRVNAQRWSLLAAIFGTSHFGLRILSNGLWSVRKMNLQP